MLSADTINRLFLAGHGDLLWPENPTDPDPRRSWGYKPGRAARPLPNEEEEEEERAITITKRKQSHRSLPERGRLWGAIRAPEKLAVGGQSPKATQGTPPRAEKSETFALKSDFCRAALSWPQAEG